MKYQLIIECEDHLEFSRLSKAIENLMKEVLPKDKPLAEYEHPIKEDALRRCIVCAKSFIPKRASTLTCSKKCYMENYFKAKKMHDLQVDPADALSFDFRKKIQEIKATCPTPKPRPDFQRDFNS